MLIHSPRSTILVTVEGDVQVDYGRRTGYLCETSRLGCVFVVVFCVHMRSVYMLCVGLQCVLVIKKAEVLR